MRKYLETYAQPQCLQLGGLTTDEPSKTYQHCLVVPMFDEDERFFLRNHDILCHHNALCIVVINQAENAPANNNHELANWLRQRYHENWRSADDSIRRLKVSETSDILVVDCFTPGHELALKSGVGLARKIGADIACRLIENKHISSNWIHNTDADVCLPQSYFRASAAHTGHAALLYSFSHTQPDDPKLATAITLYETHLHYYQRGLAWAGSPYGFHTIGSTIAVDATHYAQVRGFPKRAAGEDFYLLNKLRKTSSIYTLNNTAITIDTRLSQRTPFGTGNALHEIVQLQTPERDYRFYHPDVFTRLQELLLAIEQIAAKETNLDASLNDPRLKSCLMSMGITKALAHCAQQSSDAKGFLKHFHAWFDAFKTLKLVHALRDAGYQSVPLETVRATGFMQGYF